jgi:protein required for attachment to host cells
MLLPHGAVVAVVDGEKFELFRNDGNEAEPTLSVVAEPELEPHNRAAGARRDSSVANPTGHQLDEDSRAAAVTDWLNQQVLSRRIERLVVIASPRTLGEMRRRYHKELTAALVGELAMDLTGRGPQPVLDALRGK